MKLTLIGMIMADVNHTWCHGDIGEPNRNRRLDIILHHSSVNTTTITKWPRTLSIYGIKGVKSAESMFYNGPYFMYE